ncbi:MAG: hypothetical protein H6652_19835 [Ardenticatenaceae bacterium]|nr:hypothetical protein [Ardenticatenaceae bacterium]MCB8950299.1 hypothetical protein [Ardenticatenaceae bacterium]
MQSTPSDIVRTRLRRWFAPIVDEPGWRSNLVDEQAERLLNWGMAQVEQTAVHSQRLPDEDANPLLEKDSMAVRLIMAGVNDLIGTIGKPPEFDLVDDTMTRVLKNLRWLTNQPLRPENLRRVSQFNQAREIEDRDAAFQYLLELIQTDAA